MTDQPQTYNGTFGTNVGTYEEAVASRRARFMTFDRPVPDRPTGPVTYTNPALTPAPIYTPPSERTPVPVINDPGLLGANRPSLADINATARADWAENGGGRHHFAVTEERRRPRPVIDDTDGITEESHQEAITKAAQDRLAKLNAKVQDSK